MTLELWIAVTALAFTIVSTSAGGVFFLWRQQSKREVNDALVAKAVNNLAEQVGKLSTTIEHLDERVDEHDKQIALIKQRQGE